MTGGKAINDVCTHPIILVGPFNEITLSSKSSSATPWASVWMFPRSPTCRVLLVGAPCVLLKGLKWGPADAHPFVVSPAALLISVPSSELTSAHHECVSENSHVLHMESAKNTGVEACGVARNLDGPSSCRLVKVYDTAH